MRTRVVLAVSLLLFGCGQATPDGDPVEAGPRHVFDDPEVTRVWNDMMDVIAPDNGWERTRYLEWDWIAGVGGPSPMVRSHRWDRWEGIARYSTTNAEGVTFEAIFPVDDPTSGRAWLDGVELEGEEAEQRLNGALRSHINDGYWIFMPFKWSDPGVTATYLGERTEEDGRVWEVVQLAFDDGTGLTPQNRYHAFVNPETRRMERWNFFRSAESEEADIDNGWTGWHRVGPIELSPDRPGSAIGFANLRAETEVPAGAFDPPGGS